jgi:hypothetical protein
MQPQREVIWKRFTVLDDDRQSGEDVQLAVAGRQEPH